MAQVLLKTNDLGNLHLVVQVAKEYTEQLGKGRITEMLELLELLEAHKSYHDLGGQIALCEDPEVRDPCQCLVPGFLAAGGDSAHLLPCAAPALLPRLLPAVLIPSRPWAL